MIFSQKRKNKNIYNSTTILNKNNNNILKLILFQFRKKRFKPLKATKYCFKPGKKKNIFWKNRKVSFSYKKPHWLLTWGEFWKKKKKALGTNPHFVGKIQEQYNKSKTRGGSLTPRFLDRTMNTAFHHGRPFDPAPVRFGNAESFLQSYWTLNSLWEPIAGPSEHHLQFKPQWSKHYQKQIFSGLTNWQEHWSELSYSFLYNQFYIYSPQGPLGRSLIIKKSYKLFRLRLNLGDKKIKNKKWVSIFKKALKQQQVNLVWAKPWTITPIKTKYIIRRIVYSQLVNQLKLRKFQKNLIQATYGHLKTLNIKWSKLAKSLNWTIPNKNGLYWTNATSTYFLDRNNTKNMERIYYFNDTFERLTRLTQNIMRARRQNFRFFFKGKWQTKKQRQISQINPKKKVTKFRIPKKMFLYYKFAHKFIQLTHISQGNLLSQQIKKFRPWFVQGWSFPNNPFNEKHMFQFPQFSLQDITKKFDLWINRFCWRYCFFFRRHKMFKKITHYYRNDYRKINKFFLYKRHLYSQLNYVMFDAGFAPNIKIANYIIKNGWILINEHICKKKNYILKKDDIFSLNFFTLQTGFLSYKKTFYGIKNLRIKDRFIFANPNNKYSLAPGKNQARRLARLKKRLASQPEFYVRSHKYFKRLRVKKLVVRSRVTENNAMLYIMWKKFFLHGVNIWDNLGTFFFYQILRFIERLYKKERRANYFVWNQRMITSMQEAEFTLCHTLPSQKHYLHVNWRAGSGIFLGYNTSSIFNLNYQEHETNLILKWVFERQKSVFK